MQAEKMQAENSDKRDELLFDSANDASLQKNFEETWPYCSKVAERLQATNYTVAFSKPLRKFKSGRPICTVKFWITDGLNKTLLEARDAMQLTSKKTGHPYYVCYDGSSTANVHLTLE